MGGGIRYLPFVDPQRQRQRAARLQLNGASCLPLHRLSGNLSVASLVDLALKTCLGRLPIPTRQCSNQFYWRDNVSAADHG